jgi:aflatoxin B1 aldehyde reductase
LQVESQGFQVATKAFPFKTGDHGALKLQSQFEQSLKALCTNQVDLFYLHAPDYGTEFEETLKVVNEFYKQGKFQRFGLSNYSSWQVMEIYKICEARGYVKPTVYQGRYSVLTRDVEKELFPCLRKLGIIFYAYNPLCGMAL